MQVKFQGIALPNGLFGYLWGVSVGRNHDSNVLGQSRLLVQLQRMCERLGFVWSIYGDAAYPLSQFLIRPFVNPSREEELCNARMSAGRVTVEWAYGMVLALFPFLDGKKNMQLWLSPIAKIYSCAVLMFNCHTCLNRGNQISLVFDVPPPSIHDYLAMQGIPGVRELAGDPGTSEQ